MRRRNVPGARTENADDFSAKRALESLKHLDVYNKVHDDYLQKSQAGGFVSLITSFLVTLLFWSELNEFGSVEILDSISVDTRINQKLPISLNVTFPHLRCDEVSVDTVDSAGDNQVNVKGGLRKVSLDSRGHVTPEVPKLEANACLSCLDGEDEQHRCCNTCSELKAAYSASDLPYAAVLKTADQCKNQVGCRVDGAVVVNKVSGNVHVALGRSTVKDGKHVHEFNMLDVSNGFNTSHRIDSIAFGESVPGLYSPLEGTTKIVRHGAFMFHYYIKLVPTVFIDKWGAERYTNQYSVTDSAKNVLVRTGELSGLPGLFLVYDFSPFLMQKTEHAKPWSYIFTSSCAIIGGVFTIASLVEKVVNAVTHTSVGSAVCAPIVPSRE
eukprot:TRINITY_DN13056_c0_g1_i1.p1 TRINITY_DN13056_c0_g1~~TRINITY_DN13056_c0_g1_i1.p1  ORF type:complete len:383 (-),score=72.92 TRINITY_DN13056_c0_g1_i1:188-1336(-)